MSAGVGVLAAMDYASNVTVPNADDANELRESCTTLEGNVILAHESAETDQPRWSRDRRGNYHAFGLQGIRDLRDP